MSLYMHQLHFKLVKWVCISRPGKIQKLQYKYSAVNVPGSTEEGCERSWLCQGFLGYYKKNK